MDLNPLTQWLLGVLATRSEMESSTMDEKENWSYLQTLLQQMLEVSSDLEVYVTNAENNAVHKSYENDNTTTELRVGPYLKGMTECTGDQKRCSKSNFVNSISLGNITELNMKIVGIGECLRNGLLILLSIISSCKKENVDVDDYLKALELHVLELQQIATIEDIFCPHDLEQTNLLVCKGLKALADVTGILTRPATKHDVDCQRHDKIELLENSPPNNNLINHVSENSYPFNFHVDNVCKNDEMFQIPGFTSVLLMFKKLLVEFRESFTELDQCSKSKQHYIDNQNDIIGFLKGQLKEQQYRLECAEEENYFIKQKLEQEKTKHESTLNELKHLKRRFKLMEEERNSFMYKDIIEADERSMTNTGDEQLNVSGKDGAKEKEKDENNKCNLTKSLKMDHCLSECKEFNSDCKSFASMVEIMREEYVSFDTELTSLANENDKLKKAMEERDRELLNCKNRLRTLESDNTDLEDQLQNLSVQCQTSLKGKEKLALMIEEHKMVISDLEKQLDTYKHKAEKNITETKYANANVKSIESSLDNSNINIKYPFFRDHLSKSLVLLEYEKIVLN